jgi:biopolymer transport protein ExbB/TolQ
MTLEQGFAQVAQLLLWPVLALVALAFVYALWVGGATLMETWQRWRRPGYRALRMAPGMSLEEIELQLVHQIEPVRLLSRLAPMLGLIATMVPLGPALQSVAQGEGQQALAVFSGAFAGVVLALASASVGLVVYSVRRRWLLAELLAERKRRAEMPA